MKSFIANMHMARVKHKKKIKELPWKKYITDYELTTPTETARLVLKIISFFGVIVSVLLFFIFFCNEAYKQMLICGITAIVFFMVYNLFPIKNY